MAERWNFADVVKILQRGGGRFFLRDGHEGLRLTKFSRRTGRGGDPTQSAALYAAVQQLPDGHNNGKARGGR
jgi:hypothetical protein